MTLLRSLGRTGLLLISVGQVSLPVYPSSILHPSSFQGKPAQTIQVQPGKKEDVKILQRIRPANPIRLGGVFTRGLGDSPDLYENSAQNSTKLSEANAKWITENCDVVALSPNTIEPQTFPSITHISPLFTPLLYVYGSTLYESDTIKGNVGGWKPEMVAWTLRDRQNREVKHPDGGAHWMDFGSTAWARHWRDRVIGLVGAYGAQGVAVGELPTGNTFVGNNLLKYRADSDRTHATTRWLQEVRAPNRYLMIPSALGFDGLVGRPTVSLPPGSEQPELMGRLWDEFYPYIDGGWSEGWLRPYWADRPLPEKHWELHLEAADRAARNGQVFIAAYAYRTLPELEFGLASYLLVNHRQGRLVFQPMPQDAPGRPDAGSSLAKVRKEIAARRAYFNVALGPALKERRLLPAEGGLVWRRVYYLGAAYVNSSAQNTITIRLAGPMRMINGKRVRQVVMKPQSGVILLYEKKK